MDGEAGGVCSGDVGEEVNGIKNIEMSPMYLGFPVLDMIFALDEGRNRFYVIKEKQAHFLSLIPSLGDT